MEAELIGIHQREDIAAARAGLVGNGNTWSGPREVGRAGTRSAARPIPRAAPVTPRPCRSTSFLARRARDGAAEGRLASTGRHLARSGFLGAGCRQHGDRGEYEVTGGYSAKNI
jgi:hypothetical protein